MKSGINLKKEVARNRNHTHEIDALAGGSERDFIVQLKAVFEKMPHEIPLYMFVEQGKTVILFRQADRWCGLSGTHRHEKVIIHQCCSRFRYFKEIILKKPGAINT
ncbi:MAG: hypothetical protein GY797_13445 [Deltaproteobacteria bacterium]|nr:hypothetical protein [Deltaproteobacteria bacterium]